MLRLITSFIPSIYTTLLNTDKKKRSERLSTMTDNFFSLQHPSIKQVYLVDSDDVG